MKSRKIVSIIAVVFLFISCKKENIEMEKPLLDKSVNVASMRYFNNFEELAAEIDMTMEMGYDALCHYEQINNFESFGVRAESIFLPAIEQFENALSMLYSSMGFNLESDYQTAFLDDYIEMQDSALMVEYHNMLQLVGDYPELFVLATDNDGEQYMDIKFSASPYFYVMNKNCMFQVDTLVYKVFEDGLMACPVEYSSTLAAITGNSIFDAPQSLRNAFVEQKNRKCIDKKQIEFSNKNGNGKEKISTTANVISSYLLSSGGIYVCTNATTKAFRKTCGIFFPGKRHITQDLFVQTKVYNGFFPGYAQGTSYAYKRSVNVFHSVVLEPEVFAIANPLLCKVVGTHSIPAVSQYVNFQ